jgi:CBS domain-containing protein
MSKNADDPRSGARTHEATPLPDERAGLPEQRARVADVMRREVEFVAADATVQEAAQLMGETDVAALAVGTRDNIEGILTDRDILMRVVAKGEDCAQSRIGGVMSKMLFFCRESDSLETALDLMASHDVRRLPVVDTRDHVIGWVTLAHVWQRLMRDGLVVPARLEEVAGLPQ